MDHYLSFLFDYIFHIIILAIYKHEMYQENYGDNGSNLFDIKVKHIIYHLLVYHL